MFSFYALYNVYLYYIKQMNNSAKHRKRTLRGKRRFYAGKANIIKSKKNDKNETNHTQKRKHTKHAEKKHTQKRKNKKDTTHENEILVIDISEPQTTSYEMSSPLIYGRVYSESCPHCVRMNPYWGNLKQRLRTTVPSHEMFDVESSQFDENSNRINSYLKPPDRLDVQGYPTMFRIDNGQATYFDHNKHAKHNSMEENLYHFYIKG